MTETKDYFEKKMDGVRLAKRLANIQAFVDADVDTKYAAVSILSGMDFYEDKND